MSITADTYRIIKNQTEGFYKEKGSKFFAHAIPCDNETDAKAYINEFRKRNPNACHVCFAWRFGKDKNKYLERFSDDGEPSNSAGKPIFGQIIAYDVTNVLIAVVRIYGGTNLGVGGLINAYKTSAKSALEKADISTQSICNYYLLKFYQSETGKAYEIVRKLKLDITNTSYDGIEFKVEQSRSKQVEQQLEKLPWFKIKYLKTE
jgi:uncharacterized YigZ family protein